MGLIRSLSLISGPGEVMVYWAMLSGFCIGRILGRVPHKMRLCPSFVKIMGPRKGGHDGVVSGYPTTTSFPWVDGLSTDHRVLERHKL